MTSLQFDAQFAATGIDIARSPVGRSCGAASPDGAWTGSRQLFAWTDNSSGPVEGHETLLDVADGDGTSVEWRELYPEGDLSSPPRIAVGEQSVLLLSDRRLEGNQHEFSVLVLDAAGKHVAGPHVLPLTGDGLVPGNSAVAAGPGGFLVAAAHWSDVGLHLWSFDPNGQLLEGGPVEADDPLRYAHLEMVRRPGGYVLAAKAYVDGGDGEDAISIFAIDDATQVTRRIDIPGPSFPDYLGWPRLGQHEGTTYLLYPASYYTHAELHLTRLGCGDGQSASF